MAPPVSTLPAVADGSDNPRAVLWLSCRIAPGAPSTFAAEFIRDLLTGVVAAGADLLARIGNTVVCSVDAMDADELVELFLGLRAEVRDKGQPVELLAGLAVGTLQYALSATGEPEVLHGEAIDRAQQLANTARGTELLVDSEAHQGLGEAFLFAGEFGEGDLRCHPLDLTHARKRDCRAAVQALHPVSLADLRPEAFQTLQAACERPDTTHIILRGEGAYDPVDWLDRLGALQKPPVRLHLRKQAGAMQPLGSLQGALVNLGALANAKEPSHPALSRMPTEERASLSAIAAGQAVSRGQAVRAVKRLLRASDPADADRRPWVIADRLHHIDPATLGVLAECLPGTPGGALLLLSVNLDAQVPAALSPAATSWELSLPAPDPAERRRLAAKALGLSEDDALARRVAGLGEATTLGVLEACRTLITSGDLVPVRRGFRWRTSPRAGAGGVPVDALLTEQLAGLSAPAYRALQALCLVPPAATPAFVAAVAERDGLFGHALRAALAELRREGLVDNAGHLGTREKAVVGAVRSTMPPARSAELHRFIALSCQAQHATGEQQRFDRALLSHHLAEGGKPEPAAAALLDAAEAAFACGFQRMGMRLAAVAVQTHESAEIRARTRALVRNIDARPGQLPGQSMRPPGASGRSPRVPPPAAASPEVTRAAATPAPEHDPPDVAAQAVRDARKAILMGDHDTAERLLDTAVAAGWDAHAAQRLRAVAQLARDDLELATQTIQRSHAQRADSATRARKAVAWSLLQLQGGDTLAALRSALSALSIARTAAEPRGEAAALCMMSACYRALGDTDRADALATLVGTRSSPPSH